LKGAIHAFQENFDYDKYLVFWASMSRSRSGPLMLLKEILNSPDCHNSYIYSIKNVCF